MQRKFRYANLLDGVPSGPLLDAFVIERAHSELTAPVDSLTDAQLADIGVCRVVTNPPPIDGYNYSQGDITQQDGVWTASWVQIPNPNRDRAMQARSSSVRSARNAALAECDWTQLADASLTEEQRTAWGAYRQALRDLTTQQKFPWVVDWPVKPA